MGADKSVQHTSNAPKIICQKFGISMKKGFIGRPWSVVPSISKDVLAIAYQPMFSPPTYPIHNSRLYGTSFIPLSWNIKYLMAKSYMYTEQLLANFDIIGKCSWLSFHKVRSGCVSSISHPHYPYTGP